MSRYSEEGLENLRGKIDLIELISSYVDLKPAGNAYKGLCPFHEEKTPSFNIQRGASHYHCFGCGAHGDAIAFLMEHEKISFTEAIENLSSRFQVHLDRAEGGKEERGPKKALLKEALVTAVEFYHFYLLYTEEGRKALDYLYQRGLDLNFISTFQVGLSPENGAIFSAVMRKKNIGVEVLKATGLVTPLERGGVRPFFIGRLMFPILNYAGVPVGFSARKLKETPSGPKYINTKETALFKKGSTLYGLNFCRKRIAKEKRAIVVEGQIDALRLIQEGLTLTVAGQGTAFTQEHVKELSYLGVEQVYLLLDGDKAGREAAVKIGNLFQSRAIEVRVAQLPDESDPDTFLIECGIGALITVLEKAIGYIAFLVAHWGQGVDLNVPAQKNILVKKITTTIRSFKQPILEHESLRELSKLLEVPGKLLKIEEKEVEKAPFIPRQMSVQKQAAVNPDWVLDIDLLRWLFLEEARTAKMIVANVKPDYFYAPLCSLLFSLYLSHSKEEESVDLLALIKELEGPEQRIILAEIIKKRIDTRKVEKGVIETIDALLKRHWTWECEKINAKIASGQCSEEEIEALIKEFSTIIRNPPKIELAKIELER